MRYTALVWIPLLAILVVPLQGRAEGITADEVRKSIDRGVAYLKGKQNKVAGNWEEYKLQPGGVTALCALALLSAGVEPEDESIQKALAYLRKLGQPKMTYATSLRIMAFVAADPSPSNKDKALIRRDAEYLAGIQIKMGDGKGKWAYSAGQGSGDNSNTQFALLALYEAERVGVKIPDNVWRLSLDYWLDTQKPNGGWPYVANESTRGSMTCAGIASLVICAGKLGAGDAAVVGDRVRCCGGAEEPDDRVSIALQRAMAWMGRNRSVNYNPVETVSGDRAEVRALGQIWLLYYLYGVERVGRLTGERFFVNSRGDRFDWYREGAEFLIRKGQDRFDGSWTGVGQGENNPLVGTSFALLFLSKGRRPVVIGNLKREPGSDWNYHRSSIANLTRHVEGKWGRDLTWQTIESRTAKPEDLLQAPVLFISGRDGLKLSEREIESLRAFAGAGGFIFAEACCEGKGFDRDFRALMKELFPDSELRPLPADHPIWFAETRVVPDPEETPLLGLESCCRTSVVYCSKNLSCYWELGKPREEAYPKPVQERVERALAIGANVLAYATGRELRDKLDIPQLIDAVRDDAPSARNVLLVPKLRHGGGSDDAPSALSNLLAAARQEAGLATSSERRLIGIGDETLFHYPIVFMHGRRAFRLSDTERSHLRQYLERGGFLLADSICANEEFAESFRREMAAIFRDARLREIPASHPMFTQEFRGFDVAKITLRDPQFRAEGDPLKARTYRTAPALEGLELDGRLAVVFSPYDLSCALENSPSLECKGYDRRDAARIGVNVLLYALQQ